jgi:mRNA-degrading endonuclease RelE of RelBE toxin-antitoxin system
MSPRNLTVVLVPQALEASRHLSSKRQQLFRKATTSLARNPSRGATLRATAKGRSLRTLELDTNLRILYEVDEKLGQLVILDIVGRGGIR